ncbi:TetR/AcrR family transcriptional regulator [Vibrio neptunius]|uniref:TetR/AcrR family transcriptional regulator n=1 Tax=Vibrio neptunius TaxID=170651 RepID=A0ABS3A7F3_9VIBR|nr:TetR/AcrR family transcriptional regulator [Vibrio neptunius]MBN3495554.1 TetR/AcrR family transcriptional regulator [Vibrio neptunius]MBN3518040.1 TetR/AcrR family transcriptional regulator [Vibrio neptunius]MBN3552383.1 TetR/AcrR family transcriptional regulator [Vibrio neptunius]MBN3580397.1 TetR/AcrR family transcriptional regulator [Vibrio neptunius]MCH9874064.1 TetR/AcrR family transcriptional regulator [Vibrio neptunius]
MSKGKVTRDNILSKAFELASENGLESLTIGELAKQCGMSKSGLFAHFNSKDNLQIAVLEHANLIFTQRVITPAREQSARSQEQKIRTLLDNWLGWNHSFQGSCMFLDAWKETNSETNLTQKALKKTIATWIEYLRIQVAKGVENGEFHQDLEPKQAIFELYGLYLSAHLFYSIHGEQESYQHFWQGVERMITSWK